MHFPFPAHPVLLIIANCFSPFLDCRSALRTSNFPLSTPQGLLATSPCIYIPRRSWSRLAVCPLQSRPTTFIFDAGRKFSILSPIPTKLLDTNLQITHNAQFRQDGRVYSLSTNRTPGIKQWIDDLKLRGVAAELDLEKERHRRIRYEALKPDSMVNTSICSLS